MSQPIISSDESHIRAQKVVALRERNIEPWPATKPVTAPLVQVLNDFQQKGESRPYELAGRVMTIRHHGKASFATIQDKTAQLQLYFRQDVLGDQSYDLFKHFIDTGDILWVKGESFATKTGQTTIKVEEWTLLSKCVHPLPEKFHGLTDIETIYRQRYLDLIVHPESRERFVKRSLIIRTMRQELDAQGFLEVETPMLHPIPGGAAARPFITHHNALDDDFYLRIAPELYLKRLIVGGLERVYEINRNFRNEGISTRHNPEFTMIELYLAYHDYHYMMDLVEDLIKKVAKAIGDAAIVPFGSHQIDFSKPFARTSMKDSICEFGNYRLEDIAESSIDTIVAQHQIKLANKNASYGEKLAALFEKIVEHQLIQPTFITHYPIEISPLAKRDSKDPRFAARYELFIGGMEISNGFNELNDPYEQAERFKEQGAARTAGDAEAHHYDADYVRALEYALPPTAGMGIGIDRLAMVLTNTTSIKDVILFPTLKRRD
jgi:lysyl-tRNA synthetase class 2